jgi:hypothetical protein
VVCSVRVTDYHVDEEAAVGQRLWLAQLVATLVDRVAQCQQAGMAVGPGLLAQIPEHRRGRSVAYRPGVVFSDDRLDRDTRHGPAAKHDQPPARRLAVRRGAQGLGQRLETLGA